MRQLEQEVLMEGKRVHTVQSIGEELETLKITFTDNTFICIKGSYDLEYYVMDREEYNFRYFSG